MLKKLYIHGARIIDQRLNGVNEACRNNNFEMLAFLLESGIGADLSDEWYNGVNVACTENNFTLLRYLVNNRGATLSNGYCNGVKAAAKSDNYEMVKFLVENGAKIDVFRNSGISEAVQNSNIEILEYLLTNCEPSDGRHYTSLMYKAKKTGDMSLLEYLINYSHGNSDIDQSSLIFGLQELATAVVEGNRSVLTYFLENSCCHDRELNSVLIDACNLNDIETVKLLLEHGVGFGDSQYACLFAAMNPNVDTGNDCRGEASQLVDVVMGC
ncbi:putative ankyrin repeat protein [Zancudomyces culisetae]|uniref:Putative ankyrin repeat protein n=1 Tax=Zancudomyces culisetae TaxID=1213189 RepID=A0A1R1PSV5_ZANCU|nr:putative ankyrin repeat protein [Zancudomyces culisetae]|eukprot:OMH84075.1 putative ankyrin repeat protein [Zancudomyces culisetae]